MQRHAIGLIAIVLLAAGIAALLYDAQGIWASAALRVGAVMGALWLALPQLSVVPAWLYTPLVASFALIAWKPKLAWILLPIAVVIWVLRPRKKLPTAATKGKR